jgi:hypothetical protein
MVEEVLLHCRRKISTQIRREGDDDLVISSSERLGGRGEPSVHNISDAI